MKITEADWERRNLGRRALEVVLTRRDCASVGDALARVEEALGGDGAYVTLKAPVGDVRAVHALEDAGYRFVETQMEIECDVSAYATPPKAAAFLEPVSIREVGREPGALDGVLGMITPDMFKTDRISLDPLFGADVGCLRYRNWMRDLWERPDVHLFVFANPEDDGDLYGFTIDRLEGAVLHGILGGAFPSCGKPGIGLSIWDSYYRHNLARGVKVMKTAISSNNPSVLAIDSLLGICATRLHYVFRKQY